METLSQDSPLECQICFNRYSPRHRPKVLDCQHTCCSVCLTQMGAGQREVRCPWCRAVTRLPAGQPVSHLPDDPDAIAFIAMQRTQHTPVFIRLSSNGCYTLPLTGGDERGGPTVGSTNERQKGVAMVALPMVERERGRRGATWSGVCTVLLVAFILLFLLIIILHNMSCVSKRFTVISCG
ncbi:E3 ubiquitin-protein ligase RNF152-like [Anguilla rostrata]|uniref:E3 ubiquitin-protein ligase RNF152-like n=1 Tax=Anguilla rostrata TaxID=7938 RepID=UPI0030D38D0E